MTDPQPKDGQPPEQAGPKDAAAQPEQKPPKVDGLPLGEAEVQRVIQLIESNPEGFPKYDDLHRYALLRRFPYSIVYQHWADQIYVVGVVHGSRLPGYWKNRT